MDLKYILLIMGLVLLVGTASAEGEPTNVNMDIPYNKTLLNTSMWFNATADGATSWLWDFGDDQTATGAALSHTYAEAGTYTVSLTATNAEGSDEETKAGYITAYTPGPYSVATYADLCKVGTGADGWTLDADYIQTADIQCPAGSNFPRIGESPGTPFTGIYEGDGYVIRNLRLHYFGSDIGMFAALGAQGSLQNMTLLDVDVMEGSSNVTDCMGALVAQSYGSVTNCHSTGAVAGGPGDNTVGGLIGRTYSGSVTSRSSSSCSVTGYTNVGGLIGRNDGDVDYCSATGAVGLQEGSGFSGIGGLIGNAYSGTVTDSFATGAVFGATSTGGLIGYCQAAVTRCYATGAVSPAAGSEYASDVGGLIGGGSASISESYATGDVRGRADIGGFVGYYTGSSISNCYATGAATATDSGYPCVGGFMGSSASSGISNCFAIGLVSAPNYSPSPEMPESMIPMGGFSSGGSGAVQCYWDLETTGTTLQEDGATGKTTAEMQTLATFADWSIATPAAYTDEVWYLVPGEDYPRLAWEGLPATPPTAAFSAAPTSGTVPLTVQFNDTSTGTPAAWTWDFGDGGTSAQQHPSHTYDEPGTYTVSLTATNAEGSDEETKAGYITVYTPGPYSVATYADLCKVGTGTDGWFLNASYVQTADIQCPAEENFPIIGRDEIFEGSYDGGNHTIRGLSITSSDYSVGMFSSIGGGATLKNITLDNCNVSGIDNVGGLSGFSYGATVTNCSITGLVQGEDTIGGLIGFAVASPLYISNCIAEINVSGSDNLGGIVGELNAQNSLIDNCSVTGSIEGTGGRIGGITGSHYSGCLIRNCTASEVIIIGDSGAIGGISGEGQGGSIDGCYVSGTIRGEGTMSAGGLIGFKNQNGYVKNSTTSVTVTGGGNVGGLIGQNSGGTVDHCHVSGSVATSGNYATAGGLIGYSQASVSNCTASGSVAGNGGPIGGLIGGAYEGTYFQCSASGAVTNMGEGPTGGFFGQLGGSATECYATGPVTGVSFCGGFVGGCWGGSITDCYATGSVTADGGHHIGGFAGGGSQSIVNCYSTGLVTATNVPDDLIEYLGGFSGGGDVPSSCFWNTETSGQAASAGGAVGKTTAEMKTIATFAGWNIAPAASLTDEVWQIVDGSTYPLFAWQDVPIGEQEPVAGFSADPVLGPAPLTVQFTDESTNEPTEWVWQFGDGATSFAQHPSHTYTEPGTYTVSLEAANSAGSDLVTEPDLITVQISDAVTFVGTPTTGGSPLTVRFTVVNGDPTWSYLWSFGDGETSTDQNPVHRYTTRADTANFTVTLTITQNGETETIERPDYIRIDTVGVDTFTATQQMNIESVVTVGAISSIIAGIIVVVFVL